MRQPTAPRTRQQRKRDVLERLGHELDIWAATADAEGMPYVHRLPRPAAG